MITVRDTPPQYFNIQGVVMFLKLKYAISSKLILIQKITLIKTPVLKYLGTI